MRNTSQTCLPSSRDSPRSVVRSVPSQSRFARLAGAIRDHDPVAIAIYFQTRPDLLHAEPVGHGGLDQDFTPRWPTYIKSAEPGLAWPPLHGITDCRPCVLFVLFDITLRGLLSGKKSMTYCRHGSGWLFLSWKDADTPTIQRGSRLILRCTALHRCPQGRQTTATMYCSCGDRRQVNVKVDSPDSQAGVVASHMST